jgi:hypothetical protein
MHIDPTPTDEEAAAIVAAIELSWPRPSAEKAPVADSARWRFSGRWWNRVPAASRRRPNLR